MLDETGSRGGDAAQVVPPAQGEVLDVFGATMVVKADPAALGVFLVEQTVPPGYCVPPHLHEVDDELFYMLEGELTLLDASGGEAGRIGPGATARLPHGKVHGFRNDGAAPARCLVLARPGLQAAEMFRHFDRAGRAAGAAGLAPPEIVAICAQYGVRMAGPA
jgi:quercetin dioxygenase-like cupin family protein